MPRVGRPPVKDPKISKTVTLKASQWYLIESSDTSRAAIFEKLLDDWSDFKAHESEIIAELQDFDARSMTFGRLFGIFHNRLIQENCGMSAIMLQDWYNMNKNEWRREE